MGVEGRLFAYVYRQNLRRIKPKVDLLLFVDLTFIFCVFSPKIACQVPKPPKSNKQNKIELAF